MFFGWIRQFSLPNTCLMVRAKSPRWLTDPTRNLLSLLCMGVTVSRRCWIFNLRPGTEGRDLVDGIMKFNASLDKTADRIEKVHEADGSIYWPKDTGGLIDTFAPSRLFEDTGMPHNRCLGLRIEYKGPWSTQMYRNDITHATQQMIHHLATKGWEPGNYTIHFREAARGVEDWCVITFDQPLVARALYYIFNQYTSTDADSSMTCVFHLHNDIFSSSATRKRGPSGRVPINVC